jgi:hypothetical protein
MPFKRYMVMKLLNITFIGTMVRSKVIVILFDFKKAFVQFTMIPFGCMQNINYLKGCRPLICLDGRHTKRKSCGQLLNAIGIYPYECIYLVPTAMVEVR